MKRLLPKVNIEPERVEMFNLSAAMGPRWAGICTEFTEKIRELGPSPIRLDLLKNAKKEQAEK